MDESKRKATAKSSPRIAFEGGLMPLSALENFAIGLERRSGGADGIRIRQLYGNKGVVRCSLAF